MITLLTDFGLKDGYHGIMKGVIWSIAPGTPIADITHSIAPQNVMQGALMLQKTAVYFPPGTIHVAIVDPGVGTQRRPIAARLGAYYFIGPDNGLVSGLWQWAEAQGTRPSFYHLNQPRYWLKNVSNVFHGRDIFSPCAAHLANGVPLEALGSLISDAMRLEFPQPEPTANGWRGQVIAIDGFGNLSTNLTHAHLQTLTCPNFRLGNFVIAGVVKTFGERPPGELVALYGTTGEVMLSVVEGSALEKLQARIGDPVWVEEGA